MAGSSSNQEFETDRSATPQGQNSACSATDTRPIIVFNHLGSIISPNKSLLLARTLTLLKIQVGLEYESWKLVEPAIKNDMWETLNNEFRIPPTRKKEVFKEMCSQLKTWRKNMRNKYFTGLDVAEIKAFKDNVPEGEKIRLHQWNMFVEHEATEEKFRLREMYKVNRSKKTDVHCMGRKSYAEKADEMKMKDPARRSPNRTEVYIEGRKQPKTGKLHPKTVDSIQKLQELSSGQGSSSNACLDDDPLTQLLGKDTRGSTRGVGPVSKGKVKAIEPLRSDFERVIHSNNMMQEVVYGLQTQLASYFGRHDKSPQVQSSQFSPRSNQFSGTPESSTIPIATPSPTPSPRPKEVVKLMDMSNKVIATGYIVPTPKGTIVHTRKMLEFESKVEVINVVPGEEETTVYLGSQGCATTMNEFVGGFLVWPTYFLAT